MLSKVEIYMRQISSFFTTSHSNKQKGETKELLFHVRFRDTPYHYLYIRQLVRFLGVRWAHVDKATMKLYSFMSVDNCMAFPCHGR